MQEKFDKVGNLICPYTSEACLFYVDIFTDDNPKFCLDNCNLHPKKER